MEIRGLGIINIRSLFGVEAIRERRGSNWFWNCWDGRLTRSTTAWDLKKRSIRSSMSNFPVEDPRHAGRDLTTIIEVAARNHLLKMMGYDSPWNLRKGFFANGRKRGQQA